MEEVLPPHAGWLGESCDDASAGWNSIRRADAGERSCVHEFRAEARCRAGSRGLARRGVLVGEFAGHRRRSRRQHPAGRGRGNDGRGAPGGRGFSGRRPRRRACVFLVACHRRPLRNGSGEAGGVGRRPRGRSSRGSGGLPQPERGGRAHGARRGALPSRSDLDRRGAVRLRRASGRVLRARRHEGRARRLPIALPERAESRRGAHARARTDRFDLRIRARRDGRRHRGCGDHSRARRCGVGAHRAALGICVSYDQQRGRRVSDRASPGREVAAPRDCGWVRAALQRLARAGGDGCDPHALPRRRRERARLAARDGGGAARGTRGRSLRRAAARAP